MKSFILKVNAETELGIVPTPDEAGYTWTYNCIESETFLDAYTALLDWIKWACKELENQAIDENWDELS
jgi:hypothetical protein